jgi:hypothetical protein
MIVGNDLEGAQRSILFGPSARLFYQSLNPGLSWAVVVAAGTMLVMSMRSAPGKPGQNRPAREANMRTPSECAGTTR